MADNYNILEPVTTPSGTQQRSIRALEISSKLHAAAVLVHGTSGAVLLGQSARADSVPVTIANEDILALSRYRVSSFSTSDPGGTHTPALPSGVTNDILVAVNQPVSVDFLCANSSGSTVTKTFTIPVVSGGYNEVSILITWSVAVAGANVSMLIFPNASLHSTTFVQSTSAPANRALFLIPFNGASVTAGTTLSSDLVAFMPFTRATDRVVVQFSIPNGVTAGTFDMTVTRSR